MKVKSQDPRIKNSTFSTLAFKILQKLTCGCVTWIDQTTHKFGDTRSKHQITVTVKNRAFYKQFILRGSIGAAESYIKGDWSCSDLTLLIRIIIANQHLLESMDKGWSLPNTMLRSLLNISNYASIKKNKKNILYHYDLSDDLFSLFLDNNMQYSSAIFPKEDSTLGEAQIFKMKKICDTLELGPGDHLLEIGTGWGGLAIFAAQHYGCAVTTTTISDAQHSYTANKIQTLGLSGKVTLLKNDYRQLTGSFDKLVSVEMIESIGFHNFNKFFEKCNQLLKPNGKLFLQCITINDQNYNRYRRELDFIKAYIFPGGCLPCLSKITDCVKRETSLQITKVGSYGKDYEKTLACWQQAFNSKHQEISRLGFDQKFLRMFDFYFSYCRAGFDASYINLLHILMEKPCLTSFST